MSSNISTRALAAIFAVTTGALLLAAGPVQADASNRGGSAGDEACWLNADTGITQCFADEAELAEAVTEQTGTVLVDELPAYASRSSAVAMASYVLARMYEDASYGGSSLAISSSSSTTCTTGAGLQANFSALWDDRVSSFKSYLSCTTRIFRDAGQAGTWFGYSVNAPGVGALDNEASSYRVQ